MTSLVQQGRSKGSSPTSPFSKSLKMTQCQILPVGGMDHHHYHHVMPLARISLTLLRHFSLSLIASGRSSGLHPASSHSCCMYVRAGCPAFARPYVGVHRSTSLMSSSLLLQQCPAYLVCLTWILFVMGGRWPYSWYLVGCCRQDLDANKTTGEARRHLHKNVASNTEVWINHEYS